MLIWENETKIYVHDICTCEIFYIINLMIYSTKYILKHIYNIKI